MKYAWNNAAINANYFFSSLHPEHTEEGSPCRKVEESTTDLLQDFLFHLDDNPNSNCSGYAEVTASCDDLGKEAPARSKEALLLLDLTPAGVWPEAQLSNMIIIVLSGIQNTKFVSQNLELGPIV